MHSRIDTYTEMKNTYRGDAQVQLLNKLGFVIWEKRASCEYSIGGAYFD